jgi:hypothetical protein
MNKNSVRKPVIYGLIHDGGFFYVGRTRTNLQERFWQHSYRARSGHNAPVYAYMREVGISNIEPVELEEISDWESSASLEAEWISKLINEGHALTNQLGRDGVPDSWSEEMRAKMSIIQSGRETWIKGKRGEGAGWTDERRAAQSARRKGDYKHGARSAAIVHKCTCDECESFRISYYSKIEERKAKNTHGTVAGYKHGKCRCAECKAAYSEYQKRFYTPKTQ